MPASRRSRHKKKKVRPPPGPTQEPVPEPPAHAGEQAGGTILENALPVEGVLGISGPSPFFCPQSPGEGDIIRAIDHMFAALNEEIDLIQSTIRDIRRDEGFPEPSAFPEPPLTAMFQPGLFQAFQAFQSPPSAMLTGPGTSPSHANACLPGMTWEHSSTIPDAPTPPSSLCGDARAQSEHAPGPRRSSRLQISASKLTEGNVRKHNQHDQPSRARNQ